MPNKEESQDFYSLGSFLKSCPLTVSTPGIEGQESMSGVSSRSYKVMAIISDHCNFLVLHYLLPVTCECS
jgi:hypothetical protein